MEQIIIENMNIILKVDRVSCKVIQDNPIREHPQTASPDFFNEEGGL